MVTLKLFTTIYGHQKEIVVLFRTFETNIIHAKGNIAATKAHDRQQGNKFLTSSNKDQTMKTTTSDLQCIMKLHLVVRSAK